MRSGLEARIEKLEQADGAADLVWCVRVKPNGERIPLRPGQRLALHHVVLPEVCASSEEWLLGVAAKGYGAGRL